MKRWGGIIGAGVMLLTALWSITAAPRVSADSKNNFVINSYDVQFELDKDVSTNQSMLTTTETITATFPNYDQNHGIERYIPTKYDGHSTGLQITSVVDLNGAAWPYSTRQNGEYTVLRIGDPNTYIHGQHTFNFVYTQMDVTKAFSDTKRDEFYWDTTGVEWRVPIEQLTVSLKLHESIQQATTGHTACYQGAQGQNNSCQLQQKDNATYSVRASNLSPGENVTIAVGFQQGTFRPYQPSLFERARKSWIILQIIAAISLVPALIFLGFRHMHIVRRKRELGTIIAEYTPPKTSSIQTAGYIMVGRSVFAAQIIDLAVRHYLKIYEVKPKSLWSKGVYEMEIVKPIDTLLGEEQEFLRDVFAGDAQVGAKTDTKTLSKDYSLSSRMYDNPKKLKALMRNTYGLQQKDPEKSRWFKRFGIVFIFLGALLLTPGLFIIGVASLIMSFTLWVLTDEGLTLYRYLEGLKLYISFAEEERLKVLQSPEGANKTPVDTNNQKKLVELYEKLLPYAMLFGQEKEWNKQLGQYYEAAHTQPNWYNGATMTGFSAASFSSAMSSLSTSISSNGAASSSSGGSSGGGHSGGGGGGGGGGGW